MTRDVDERLKMYSRVDEIEVIRLALNWDQVELWQPPENPAKETDARYAAYQAKYGDSSWELDAVEPAQLANLVREAVNERLDKEAWENSIEEENEMRSELEEFANNYGDKDD